ncbi:hypothetical protein D9M68_645920 [compost metagenome]
MRSRGDGGIQSGPGSWTEVVERIVQCIRLEALIVVLLATPTRRAVEEATFRRILRILENVLVFREIRDGFELRRQWFDIPGWIPLDHIFGNVDTFNTTAFYQGADNLNLSVLGGLFHDLGTPLPVLDPELQLSRNQSAHRDRVGTGHGLCLAAIPIFQYVADDLRFKFAAIPSNFRKANRLSITARTASQSLTSRQRTNYCNH